MIKASNATGFNKFANNLKELNLNQDENKLT